MCLKGPWGRVKLVQLPPGHNPRIDLPPREKGPLMQVGGLQGHPAGQEGDATALAVAEIPHEECWEIHSRVLNGYGRGRSHCCTVDTPRVSRRPPRGERETWRGPPAAHHLLATPGDIDLL